MEILANGDIEGLNQWKVNHFLQFWKNVFDHGVNYIVYEDRKLVVYTQFTETTSSLHSYNQLICVLRRECKQKINSGMTKL